MQCSQSKRCWMKRIWTEIFAYIAKKKIPKEEFQYIESEIGVLCALQTFATFISHRILPFSKSHCTRIHSGIILWWLLLLLYIFFVQILYLVRVCVLAYTVESNRLIHCAIALFPSYDISTFVWRDFASVNASFWCFFLFIFLFLYLIFLSVSYRFKAGELNKKKQQILQMYLLFCVHLANFGCSSELTYHIQII